jgi:carbon starvation protein
MIRWWCGYSGHGEPARRGRKHAQAGPAAGRAGTNGRRAERGWGLLVTSACGSTDPAAMKRGLAIVLWALVALTGGASYAVISTYRGERLNAAWILTAAACTFAIGYRFYSKWIAAQVMALDDRRATPCEVHDDGRDFVKTNRWIVLGHHFAAISGPGPLVGPVLAAQFGYLPGTLWLLVGVVLGGAVQDFMILFGSMRRDGKSLGEMVKDEVGTVAGILSLVAIVSIMVILIAVLGLVVVKALAHSPWGTFTIGATLPIAVLMGIYLRFLRPGRVLEVTAIGVALLLLAVWGGRYFHEVPALSRLFTLDASTLAWTLIAYGLAASILPVWLLLAPRDYLSTFMKLGTIGALALGILFVLPPLIMPPLTRFIDGSGPVFAGNVFPFCFITIACGAISGFHSLIASGTTPKLIGRESHARSIGYGAMLMESAVAIMALIAACTLEPGVYFAMNSPAALIGATPDAAVKTISGWGFPVTTGTMTALARDLGENTMFGRAGGAPTLAVGMAHVFSQVIGGKGLMALWYHFAIMFEALFILTTVDAGTRVGRFLIQAFLGQLFRPLGDTKSWGANVLASALLVAGWGYFLYQGVVDPLGGINSLWPLFGIANQLLSVVALCLATTVLIKMGKARYLWVTLLPTAWVGTVTFTAAITKISSGDPKIGFLAQASSLSARLAKGAFPADKIREIEHTVLNLRIDAAVAGLFLLLVGSVLLTSAWRWATMLLGRSPLDLRETEPVWLPASELVEARGRGILRWLGNATVLGLGLIRHLAGQGTPEEARFEAGLCAAKHTGHSHPDPGAAWAAREEHRHRQPKCC